MGWSAVAFDAAAEQRIAKAAAFEKRLRLEAFLGIDSDLCGIVLRQPTCGDILELEFVENRFTTDEPPQIDDYAHLAWTLRPIRKRRFWQRRDSEKRYLRRIMPALQSEVTRSEIDAFYWSAFNDIPHFGGSSNANKYDSSVWLCSIIDTLCSEYGWTCEQVMATPLAVAFQLMQRIAKRNLGSKYAIRNGITQRAKANEMERLKAHG